MYDRAKSFGWLATDKGILPLQALQKFVFQKILLKQLEKRVLDYFLIKKFIFFVVKECITCTRLWTSFP